VGDVLATWPSPSPAGCWDCATLGRRLVADECFFWVQTGIETLPLRMQRHCDNALTVAKWLKANPKIGWVNYAGLEDNPCFALHKKYCPKGAGAVFHLRPEGAVMRQV